MSDHETSERLALCETILEDGELSYDELYKLAEWLNEYRETSFHWPGNHLVAPLQNAWVNGRITKTKARQVAWLILKICKVAAKRESEEAFAQAAELASQAARSGGSPVDNLEPLADDWHSQSRHSSNAFAFSSKVCLVQRNG